MSTDRCIAIPTNILLKPNFTKFAKQLELQPTMALGLLTRFYAFVPNVSYEGDLSEFHTDDIVAGAGWAGDPEAFINALLDHGFMTKDFKVADWPERFPFYAGALRRRALREAKQSKSTQGQEATK